MTDAWKLVQFKLPKDDAVFAKSFSGSHGLNPNQVAKIVFQDFLVRAGTGDKPLDGKLREAYRNMMRRILRAEQNKLTHDSHFISNIVRSVMKLYMSTMMLSDASRERKIKKVVSVARKEMDFLDESTVHQSDFAMLEQFMDYEVVKKMGENLLKTPAADINMSHKKLLEIGRKLNGKDENCRGEIETSRGSSETVDNKRDSGSASSD